MASNVFTNAVLMSQKPKVNLRGAHISEGSKEINLRGDMEEDGAEREVVSERGSA
jgi:hypothetical protein